jgi:hypothetical protein
VLASLNPAKWDLYKAAHLLNRAGFGGSPDEIAAFHKLGLEAAIERLLTIQDDLERFSPPDFSKASLLGETVEPASLLGAMPAPARKIKEFQLPGYQQTKMLRTWWLERMRFSPNPLREKMTLFWHGHFATGVQKVGDSYLMWQQLFAPPNVKGWDGGKAWITTNTLLERYNFSQSFLRGGSALFRLDMENIAPPKLRSNISLLLSALSFRLFQSRPVGQPHAIFFDFLERKAGRLDDQIIRDLLHLMMSTPQFQLT